MKSSDGPTVVQFNQDVHITVLIGNATGEGPEQVDLLHRLSGKIDLQLR